jgi:hypothetical protein
LEELKKENETIKRNLDKKIELIDFHQETMLKQDKENKKLKNRLEEEK